MFDGLVVEEWQARDGELLSFGCKLDVPEFPPQAVTVQGPGTGKLRVELELAAGPLASNWIAHPQPEGARTN